MKPKTKPKYSTRQSICFMVDTAWHSVRSVLWLCVLFAVLTVGINLAQLFVAPMVLQKVEVSAPLGELLGTIGIFTAILLILNALLGYLDENIMYGRIDVRSTVISKINHKAYTTSYPNTKDPEVLRLHHEALSNCDSNDEASEHIWHTLTSILINGLGFSIYLFLLADLNPVLIGIVTATTAAGFFVSSHINGWEYRNKEEKARYDKEISYLTKKTESIQLAKDIRIFGLAPWLNGVYTSVRTMAEAFVVRRERVYAWTCVVDVILQLARNGIAYFYLIQRALTEGLAASEFLLYFTAFTGFSGWVTGILSEFTTLHKECLALSVIQEYIHLPEKFRFSGGIPIPKAESYELKLENVTFRYPGTEKDIIRNMTLTVHPGEKIAVVGLNGAGKTTLVKLLCGFYDPDEGRVLLNGTDIREFNRQEYYDLFSAVFQEMSMLDLTVAEHVAQSAENIDMEKVKDCLEKAGLTGKIGSLPQGLQTHVGKIAFLDGVELSGGETQRLILARALYKDGPLLVLDEPTAALDPIAENDIYQKYHEMTRGKTSVFISHRLASTRFCDRILFLRDGVIAEEGTHEELLARNGEYAKLFHIQARYYQEGGKATLRETWRLHWRAYKDIRSYDSGVFAISAAHRIAGAISPYVGVFFSARIINELAGLRRAEELARLAVAAVVCMGFMTLLTGLLLRWEKSAEGKYIYRKYHLFADKMLSMDFADVDNSKTHDLLSQIRQSENWAGWGLKQLYYCWGNFVEGCAGIVGAVALTVSLFTLEVPAESSLSFLNHPAFVALLMGLVAAATALGPICRNKSEDAWAACAEDARFGNRVFGAFGFVSDDARRAMDFRIYKQEAVAEHYLHTTDVFSADGKMAKLARGPMGAWAAAGAGIGSVLTGIVYVFVCLKAWAGAFGVGSVTQYVGAVTALSRSVSILIECVGKLKNNVPFLKTTYEFLDIPNAMYQGSLTTEKRADRKYEIEFRNVSFRYPGSEVWALRNVNMKFRVGSRLAVVGENGSGKTTFIKLLCRLYDPQEGQILLNGIDIRKYRYDDYRKTFSVVFQDFQLLAQPLGNNVAGAEKYDKEKVRKALADAGFGDRLETMPKGLDTMLYKDLSEDGVEVSGGEAQKIAIARALYKDAPFIILDEPTAALDPIAEAEIYEKFNDIAGDRTAVYISHRLSSCKFCDEIACSTGERWSSRAPTKTW